MSSILATGSTTPAFISDTFNSNGGLDIIGKENTRNIIRIVENGAADLGDDFIIGGKQKDIIESSSGDDIIFSGGGNDLVSASDGNDLISGGAGNDILRGGDGDDYIIGGRGNDYITGGKGMDIFEIQANDFASGEVDRYLDFEDSNTDTLRISGVSEPVTYDSKAGVVKVGNDSIAYIGRDLDIEITKLDEDTYDLF